METLMKLGDLEITFVCTEEAEAIIYMLTDLAASEGWRPGDQLRAYPRNSVYFAVTSQDVPIGGLQLVVANGIDPLPSRCVWPEIDLSVRTDIAHVAILALQKDYRGTNGLFGALCVEMWRYCATLEIKEVWLEATPATYRLYRRMGWPLEIAGPLRLHWGEECYLCRMSVSEVAQALCGKALRSPANSRLVTQAYRGNGEDLKLTAA